MKKFIPSIALLIVISLPIYVSAQQNALREKIEQITKPVKGIVGVSILGIESRDTLSYNGNARLVLQSVMKFPIALTVLHLIDTGKLSLDQMVHITKKELVPNSHTPIGGPLMDKFPKGTDIPVRDLLGYMVSQSDNTACDALLRLIEGPKTVQDYMLRLHIKGIAIRASEADMESSWELQFTDWCKPVEMTRLLDMFYKGDMLTKASTDYLLKLMTETASGPNRIKALLPSGTVVAHKAGTSGTNAEGLSPATNDVGIITLPNGKHIAISVFVCNSKDDEATCEGVIAKISKAAFDAYSH
jgi:beta-lactamase class A